MLEYVIRQHTCVLSRYVILVVASPLNLHFHVNCVVGKEDCLGRPFRVVHTTGHRGHLSQRHHSEHSRQQQRPVKCAICHSDEVWQDHLCATSRDEEQYTFLLPRWYPSDIVRRRHAVQ